MKPLARRRPGLQGGAARGGEARAICLAGEKITKYITFGLELEPNEDPRRRRRRGRGAGEGRGRGGRGGAERGAGADPGGRALLPAARSHSRETLPKRRGRKRHKGGGPAGLSEGRTVHAEEPRPRPGDAFDSEPSPRQRVGARRTRGASGHPAGQAPPGRDPPPHSLTQQGTGRPSGWRGRCVSSTAAFGLWKVARTCRTG